MINKNSLYMMEGHDLQQLEETLTKINAMSGQQLAGKGGDLRDLAQKAQLHVEAAIEADDGEAANATEFVS